MATDNYSVTDAIFFIFWWKVLGNIGTSGKPIIANIVLRLSKIEFKKCSF